MTPAKPEGVDPKYLKLSYQADEGTLSRRDLLFGPLTPRYEVVPAVEAEACAAWKGCAQCLAACPQGAIGIDGSAATIDKAKCISCGTCLPVCPAGAIRQPLLDRERLEVELKRLLRREAGEKPGVLLLVADGGVAPDGPNAFSALRLPSLGALSPWLLLRAFTLGADGVAVIPCGPGCRHRCDRARWEQTLEFTRGLLARFGIEADRIQVVERAETESQTWLAAFAGAMAAREPHWLQGKAGAAGNGTPGLSAILRNLTASAFAPPAPLVGDVVPFGMVRVQTGRCTLCGACPDRCPAGALTLREDAGASQLIFDHARCNACEACVRVCPEGAMEMERRLEFSRLGRPTLLAEDEMARCKRCGAAIAPQRMLRKVQDALGQSKVLGRYCPACQMLQSLASVRR